MATFTHGMKTRDQTSLTIFAEKNNIRFFLVGFVDLLGVLRSKLVPASAIEQIEESGAGFAGFATHFDMTPADPDVMAIPDSASVIQLPWKNEVAWVASDLYVNGQLLRQAPRQVLKDQIAKGIHMDNGYMMKTGVECEFFLLRRESSSGSGVEPADEYVTASKPCYIQGALMRRFDVISKLLEYMEIMGWNPYQADHEDGRSQFEINWKYDDCLATADKHVFFKFMVKSVAEQHGFQATFMPKPFRNQTGNGCHCHVSIWSRSLSTNLFRDESNDMVMAVPSFSASYADPNTCQGLSGVAYSFLSGVLLNAKAMCAVFNSTVNSYKRLDGQNTLSGSTWAPPPYVSYSGNNRTHMVRIPDKGRFELRIADGAVNPYLLPAVLLASGLSGIERKLAARPRCDWNAYECGPPEGLKLDILPTNLLDALRELDQSEHLNEALGRDFVRSYYKVQMQQWKSYSAHITRWELENTLDC